MLKTQRLTRIVLGFILIWLWVPAVAGQGRGAEPRLTILLVNDDGYDAPGLKAMIEALSPLSRLVVAAPATQQSGAGHGITYREPIMVTALKHRGDFPWYSIAARPATCVRLALEALMDGTPDLVVSGINRGENLGLATFLSGTVAAAREAAFSNLPAIAVSMEDGDPDDFRATATYVSRLIEQLQQQKLLRPGLFLNVNVPSGVARGIKGVQITRLSLKPAKNSYQRRASPRGQLYFWNVYHPVDDDVEGTDVHAHKRGFISITPLGLDQTRTADLEDIRVLTRVPSERSRAR